jgi:hypothetical protein
LEEEEEGTKEEKAEGRVPLPSPLLSAVPPLLLFEADNEALLRLRFRPEALQTGLAGRELLFEKIESITTRTESKLKDQFL